MLLNLLGENLLIFLSGIIPYFLSNIFIVICNYFNPTLYGNYLSYGSISMWLFAAYALDNFSIKKQKNFLLINYIVNLLCGIIYFLYYKSLIHLNITGLKILFLFFGGTLPSSTSYLLKIVKIYYLNHFSFIFNFFTGIIWFITGLIIYFNKFLINYSIIFFLIYIISIILLIGIIGTQDQIEDKKPLSLPDTINLIIKDKNYWLITIFFLFVLNVQFYFIYVNLHYNIYALLFGSIIGCFFYYYILPKITFKEALLFSLIGTIWMLILPLPISSFLGGLVGASSFLSYIYVIDKYYYNMYKIFAIWNILHFILKNLTIFFIHYLNHNSYMFIKYIYIFLLTIYFLYIMYEYQE